MNKKSYHNLSSYLELSPFIIVHSLLMHVIVLSFLLTLPMYSKVNEKESLRGYYVYLMDEKTNKTQASTGRNMSEKQIDAKNIETAIIPGKAIDDVKNKEETAPIAGPDKETGNGDIKMENITGEAPSIIRQNEIYTDSKLMDIKPSYTGPEKEAEIMGKETDKIEKTKTATPIVAVENGGQTEKPVEPHIQPEAISSGIDQVQKKNVENISGGDGRKHIESPFADLQPPPKNDASVSEMKFPARGIELSGTGPSQIMEEAKTIDKGEPQAEQPVTTAPSIFGNKTVQDKKNAIYAADDNEKALTDRAADTQGKKQSLPEAAAKKLPDEARVKKVADGISSSPLKTRKAVFDKKTERRAEAPKATVNTESSKTTVQTVVPAQKNVQDDPGQKGLSIKKEKVLRLLPDIDNILKKAFLELQPVYEKTPELYTEAKLPVTPHALAGGATESYNRTEKAEADIKYDNGPEKKVEAISKINGKFGQGAEAEEEKSVLGLPMDEAFFNKDIKIEVLQQNAESHGVYMYLLKNTYLSLRKRHTWGKEKKIETIVETKRNNDAENEMKTVFSVTKSDEGIYTFVIENRNMVPYNIEVVFVLYGGQKRERIKKISAVSVPPSSMLRFMFVLPDTVFWDDEKFFTGSIEDSDSITKFNDETGFVWKEGKDD